MSISTSFGREIRHTPVRNCYALHCARRTDRLYFRNHSAWDARCSLVVGINDARDCQAEVAEVFRLHVNRLETFLRATDPAIRLRNAAHPSRCALYAGLDDRIQPLPRLNENPSAECLSAFSAIPPIARPARTLLSRAIAVDLDAALIGPRTTVRRQRG